MFIGAGGDAGGDELLGVVAARGEEGEAGAEVGVEGGVSVEGGGTDGDDAWAVRGGSDVGVAGVSGGDDDGGACGASGGDGVFEVIGAGDVGGSVCTEGEVDDIGGTLAVWGSAWDVDTCGPSDGVGDVFGGAAAWAEGSSVEEAGVEVNACGVDEVGGDSAGDFGAMPGGRGGGG